MLHHHIIFPIQLLHQLDFYKDLRMIQLNTRLKCFQIINIQIEEPVMLSHYIIVPIQVMDQSLQNGTVF